MTFVDGHRKTLLALTGSALLAAGLAAAPAEAHGHEHGGKIRTVVTTDMEQDDLASLVRYLLYANDVETQGIVYTSSRFHWAGDGRGTEFFLPGREYSTPQTSWRWTGMRTIQDRVLPAYGKVVGNLRANDPDYPAERALQSIVRVGNIDFEGEMAHDTPGSDLIRDLLLDRDPRPLYLQAWGGTSTIARALKSVEDRYSGARQWQALKERISRKAVILASGFQDETYADYIAPHWPSLRVENLAGGYETWGYNCDNGSGNRRGEYFEGDWIRANIQIGPYGRLYRSWLDGQSMPGDPLDIFGDPELAPSGWCKPLKPYDFLSEGDNVVFNPLLTTGIQAPDNPALGGWGGRAVKDGNVWVLDETEAENTRRWAVAAQNDFAARIQWTLSRHGDHPPVVRGSGPSRVRAGQTVRLSAYATDPDRDRVTLRWWQYREEGSYPAAVTVRGDTVRIPADARPGQTISLILEGTDDFPLTRYARVLLTVR
jgi:hypothetical protein